MTYHIQKGKNALWKNFLCVARTELSLNSLYKDTTITTLGKIFSLNYYQIVIHNRILNAAVNDKRMESSKQILKSNTSELYHICGQFNNN